MRYLDSILSDHVSHGISDVQFKLEHAHEMESAAPRAWTSKGRERWPTEVTPAVTTRSLNAFSISTPRRKCEYRTRNSHHETWRVGMRHLRRIHSCISGSANAIGCRLCAETVWLSIGRIYIPINRPTPTRRWPVLDSRNNIARSRPEAWGRN